MFYTPLTCCTHVPYTFTHGTHMFYTCYLQLHTGECIWKSLWYLHYLVSFLNVDICPGLHFEKTSWQKLNQPISLLGLSSLYFIGVHFGSSVSLYGLKLPITPLSALVCWDFQMYPQGAHFQSFNVWYQTAAPLWEFVFYLQFWSDETVLGEETSVQTFFLLIGRLHGQHVEWRLQKGTSSLLYY